MDTSNQEAGRTEGERRKQAKTGAVERRRLALVRAVQRALVEFLMVNPSGSTDDIRDSLTIPEGSGTSFWGAAVLNLALARIIRRVEFMVSTRPQRHGCRIGEWTLAVDHDRARQWLATHRDLAVPTTDSDAGKATPGETPPTKAPTSNLSHSTFGHPNAGAAQQTFSF